MDEYCITIFGIDASGEPYVVVHAQHDAPTPTKALEAMFRQCLAENVSLSTAHGVVLELRGVLPEQLLEAYEQLRFALHGGQPARTVAPTQHLH